MGFVDYFQSQPETVTLPCPNDPPGLVLTPMHTLSYPLMTSLDRGPIRAAYRDSIIIKWDYRPFKYHHHLVDTVINLIRTACNCLSGD